MPKVQLTFVDNKGKKVAREIFFAQQADHAANMAFAGMIRAEWDALSLGIVSKSELVYEEYKTATLPTGNVNLGIVAAFGVVNDEALISRVTVPAPIAAAVLPLSNDLDRAQAQVAAVIARLEGGEIQEYRGAVLVTVQYAAEEGGDPGGA